MFQAGSNTKEAFDIDCAFVWAEVILSGDVSSFVRPVSEDDLIELERSHRYNFDFSASFFRLKRVNDNLFLLFEDYTDCTIFTDKDGVDHWICSSSYYLHDEKSILGDEVLGLHKLFPYYFKYDKYLEMEEEEYDFNTSVHRMPPWMADRKKR